MQYTREFLINGKSPDKFVGGTTDKVIFTDKETGREFNSFLDMVKVLGTRDSADCESRCTSVYHKYAPYSPYIFTDGVYEICNEHECWWIQDVISSYIRKCCSILVQFKDGGEYEFIENPYGQDDFLIISIIKTSDNSCMFTIEIENPESDDDVEYNKTIACQYVPFTDLDIDQIEFWCEHGVIIHPNEH